MSTAEKLCLQWNEFKENISSSLRELREDREFADVTLACEDGQQIEAHKVVLASSSPFFMELLKKTKHPHPLIYMRGLRSEDLVAIMDFLYCGEANVLHEHLNAFLVLAEDLSLKGLSVGVAETERSTYEEITQDQSVVLKTENSHEFTAPLSNPNCEGQSTKMSYDTTVVVGNDKIKVGLHNLDEQIRSMITRSNLSAGPGKGFLASCNVCGKQGPKFAMPKHIEAYHITGISISCEICGKVSSSRHGASTHKSRDHRAIKA